MSARDRAMIEAAEAEGYYFIDGEDEEIEIIQAEATCDMLHDGGGGILSVLLLRKAAEEYGTPFITDGEGPLAALALALIRDHRPDLYQPPGMLGRWPRCRLRQLAYYVDWLRKRGEAATDPQACALIAEGGLFGGANTATLKRQLARARKLTGGARPLGRPPKRAVEDQ